MICYLDAKQSAKYIKAELETVFPFTKFSVRSYKKGKYDIVISWHFGQTLPQVQEFIEQIVSDTFHMKGIRFVSNEVDIRCERVFPIEFIMERKAKIINSLMTEGINPDPADVENIMMNELAVAKFNGCNEII